MIEDSTGGGVIGPTGDVDARTTSARDIEPEPAGRSRSPVAGVTLRMPAEWERHEATWIAWPHHEPDWPGKLAPIPWVYAEIVRVLHAFERVEILCHDQAVADNARLLIAAHGVADRPEKYRLHMAPNDRVWLRDSAPTFVYRT